MHAMLTSLQQVIQAYGVLSYKHSSGILVCHVNDTQAGLHLAENVLSKIIDKTTVLFLSGGKTPKELYSDLAREGKLYPGAVGLVDERFDAPMHENSNERMLKETGFLSYCKYTSIPVYTILSYSHPDPSADGEGSKKILHSVQNDRNREETARRYEEQVRTLFAAYRKHVAVLGIGLDGHTAGLPATSSLSLQGDALESWKEELRKRSKNRMVIDYNDKDGFYKERTTMTFLGLSMMDLLLVLVFGKEKKPSLELMFADESEEEIPSRFFKRPEIAKKTILITDQTI